MAQARSAVLQRLKQPAPRLGVKTSMRNQWPCVVESVERLGPIARVHLQAAEPGAVALSLASRITAESAELLGLQPGQALLALCKATAVRAMPYAESPAAGVNWWEGRVTRLSRGPRWTKWPRSSMRVCRWWALRRQAAACGCGPGSSCRWMNRRWCWHCGIEGWAAVFALF